jgi:RNA polymerase sigma-70 factor (ECF subfamily)
MLDEAAFRELMQQVRAGDESAATQLVRHYEPVIRRAMRFRMADRRLDAALDSMDICQSVLASFFVRTAAGQFDLDQPEKLVKLLVTMARNKLTSQARRHYAQRRDRRRTTTAPGDGELGGTQSTPSQQIAARELLQELYRRLTPEELELVQLRNQGEDWSSIAHQLGGNAVLMRKRLSRALDRVSQELGLDEGHV